MKGLEDLHLPGDRRYTEDHLWVMNEGTILRLGISDFGQDQLGEIVSVELPDVGDELNAGEECSALEALRDNMELLMPVSGTVVAINSDVEDEPNLINDDPYDTWIVEINSTDPYDEEDFLSANEYSAMLEEENGAGEDHENDYDEEEDEY